MEKGMKIAKVIHKILGVFFWICVVCGVLMLGAGLFALLAKEGDIGRGGGPGLSVTLGNWQVYLADWTLKQYRTVSAVDLLCALVEMPFACWEIRVLQRIFRAVGDGRPFCGELSPALRRLAWVNLISGVVIAAGDELSVWCTARVLDVASLFDMSKVSAVRMNVRVDGSFLVSFVILLLMSFVFQYGEKLQKPDDETL